MANLPKGPLGLTGVVMASDVKIAVSFDKVVFSVGGVGQRELTPAVARQVADWLNFFATNADETAARMVDMERHK